MDYRFPPWGGMYSKRQHRPDENGDYWCIYRDSDGNETVLYRGPSPAAVPSVPQAQEHDEAARIGPRL